MFISDMISILSEMYCYCAHENGCNAYKSWRFTLFKITLWLKTRFLHQYIKTKIRQQRATNIQMVLSNKRENKSISNPIWKEPLIMISITKYTLSLPGEKQAQKKTTFILKNKKFFAGLLLFLFISR